MTTHAYVYAKVFLLATALTLPVARAQDQEALKQFVGKWKAMVSFTQGGGRFTASLAEQLEVKQPDRNTIEFSVKPVTRDEPVFHTRLSYNITSKSYLLDVKTSDKTRGSPSVLEKLKLTYNRGTGFSGEGMLTDPGGKSHPVKVSIAPKEKGEYYWTVLDPSAPAGNDIVFSFTFFERINARP
ncbi:MAG: hypothetical protein AAB654_15830 [Acidobacteriota bacterium]